MDGGEYALIDIDQSERHVVSRHLRRLDELHEKGSGAALISQLQEKGLLSGAHIDHPKHETEVLPLFYWLYKNVTKNKEVMVNE